jgi:hypothetical protein
MVQATWHRFRILRIKRFKCRFTRKIGTTKWLFGGILPPNRKLFGGIVPPSKKFIYLFIFFLEAIDTNFRLIKISDWYLRLWLRFETWYQDFALKLRLVVEIAWDWNWDLKLRFEIIWDWDLQLGFPIEIWDWNLRLRFEFEIWN